MVEVYENSRKSGEEGDACACVTPMLSCESKNGGERRKHLVLRKESLGL